MSILTKRKILIPAAEDYLALILLTSSLLLNQIQIHETTENEMKNRKLLK